MREVYTSHTKRKKREVTFVGGRKNRREQVTKKDEKINQKKRQNEDKIHILFITKRSHPQCSIAATTPHLNTPLFSTFPFKSSIYIIYIPFSILSSHIISTSHSIAFSSITISVSNNYSSTFMFHYKN